MRTLSSCFLIHFMVPFCLVFPAAGQFTQPPHDLSNHIDCLDCHSEDAHSGLPPVKGERVTLARLVSQAESAPVLAAKLEASEQANQSLMIIAPLALGFGVSLGIAMVGVLVMVFCYVNRRESIL